MVVHVVISSAFPHRVGLSCVTPQLEKQALSLGSKKTNCSEAWLHACFQNVASAFVPEDLEVGVILVPRSCSV